ncbi:MAG TPA: hypothetical protein VMS43_06100 [Allosphingosinicella sp.]|nr:hypothetical protein [Allosphingosinicella sp.]
MLILRLAAILALISGPCASAQQSAAPTARLEPAHDIRYVSTDLGHVLVFTRAGARFGDFLALSPGIWPTNPVEIVPAGEGVQCITIGPPENSNSVQIAIKRPLRVGDRYSCLRESFRVIRCFEDCRAAMVETQSPGSGNNPRHDPLKSYMYVDSCRGLLAYSVVRDMTDAIPLSAMWLRGDVGILADPRSPPCDSLTEERD